MATNNIKPFATDSSANVLTDTALASRSELQTGFPLKSKADSALIGKLMQNATAGAYAVGEFSAKYGTTDIAGSDATGFATAFESALESYVEQKAPAPDLSNYATKAELSAKADASSLANYAPIANPIFTGSVTVPAPSADASAATKQYVDSQITSLNISQYATTSALTSGLATKADASTLANYAPLAGAAFTGAITVQEPTAASNPATKQYVDSAVSSVLKYKGTVASESALPQSDQAVGDVWTTQDSNKEFAWDGTKWIELGPTVDLSGYLTTESASTTYLTKTAAQSTYQLKGDYATNTALAAKADSSALANYAPLASPAFTGTATLGGQTIATVNQIPDISNLAAKTELAGYLPLAGGTATGSITAPTFIGNLTGTASEATHATSADSATNSTNAATAAACTGNAATATKLAAARTISLTGLATGSVAFDGSADAAMNVTAVNDASKVALTGSRGTLAGYEATTVSGSALTVNQDSPDSQQLTAAVAITVSNGAANTAWVKKISIKNASATISLGSAWTWVGGSQPTVTAPSLLVLSWDNDCGMAILNTTG